jgi:predicted NUDIX family NTP pyrophosphohydrolase
VTVRRSAGIVLFRRRNGSIEVLLGHMGGPLWSRRDAAAWSIPKGEYDDDEHPLDAARREFREETGSAVPDGDMIDLGEVRQSSRKIVRAWAVEGDLDETAIVCNTFALEWPPKSGIYEHFPEIDRAAWFDLAVADTRIVAGQRPFLAALADSV